MSRAQSASTHSDDDGTRTTRERRELRDKVLRVIDYQTSPKQPPGVPEQCLRRILIASVGVDRREFESALRATVEHGQAIRWTDNGGSVTRYTVVDGEHADPDTLLRLNHYAGERGARELAGYAYRKHQEVSDDE